jgi:hypothetical protein
MLQASQTEGTVTGTTIGQIHIDAAFSLRLTLQAFGKRNIFSLIIYVDYHVEFPL